jgi:hypothetical protein
MAPKDETPWQPNPRSSPPCAVSSAAALAIIGFTWGGWVTGSNATELVRQRVQTELVEALTPVCVDKFNRALDAPAWLLELKKVASWWGRQRFVRYNDWAKFGKESNSRVGDTCAVQLFKL